MSDRDPRHDDEFEPEVEPGLAGGSGGPFLMPTDAPIHHAEKPGVGEVEDVDEYDAPEGDEGLLEGGSPEFEHLTRPTRRKTD